MALSGQITVTTAGTAVRGDSQRGMTFLLAAHPDNTDTVWVGSDEAASPDVSATIGFPLSSAGTPTAVIDTHNLNNIWFDADVSGEKVCWLRIA